MFLYRPASPLTAGEAHHPRFARQTRDRRDGHSPSNAKLIAQTIKTAAPTIPISDPDADLAKEDAALRKTYLGTDNWHDGRPTRRLHQEGQAVTAARSARSKKIQGPTTSCVAAQGMRDTLTGRRASPS
jgi:ribose transport system substrate-binding protein